MRIMMPTSIKSDHDGYQELLAIHDQLKDCCFKDIQLDFSKTKWFDANLFAIFGAFLSEAKSFNNVSFTNMSMDLQKVMIRSRFIQNKKTHVKETYTTSIKYRKFPIEEEQRFCDYIEKELLERNELPSMSYMLKKKMLQKLLEVFSNAHQHSKSDFVYSCGQYYHKNRKLSFTIVDIGLTIRDNVKSFLNKDIGAIDAILWAVDEGNTTRPKSEGIPGGLGLKLLRGFMALNKGKIQIISDCGLWEQLDNASVNEVLMSNPLPGTAVNIEFNLNDTGSYKLHNEPEIVF